MPTPTERRAADGLALALVVLMAALVLVRLAGFPGLHGDEAWVGLFAGRLRARGLYTPHEMNTYTGALYGWLVTRVFARFGAGVLQLRLPGAALNVLSWLVFWRAARRAGGPWAGLCWAALAAASAEVTLLSRVAWEVCALQPLFAALALTGALALAEGGGAGAALLLFYASLLGAQNHFIFLSLPAALLLAAGALYARRPDARRLGLLCAAAANLIPCGLLFVIKPLVSEAAWPRVEVPALAAFWLSPLAAWAVLAAAPRWSPAVAARFAAPRARAAAPWLRRLFVLAVVVFFWFHWVALIGVGSGAVVWGRLASLRLSDAAQAALYAAAGGLLAAVFADSFARLGDGAPGLELPAALLAALPGAYAAVFIAFRNTSSERYYIIAWELVLLALAAGLTRWRWARRPGLVAPLAAAGVAAHALCWYVVAVPRRRAPITVYVGWHRDKSRDFLDKGPLYARLQREHVCRLVYDDSMLDVPVQFEQQLHPVTACDRAKAAHLRYSAEPPYATADVVAARP